MIKKLLSPFFAVLLYGCSSTVIEKEVLAYNRIADKSVDSGMPNFYLMDYEFDKTKRAPASIQDHQELSDTDHELALLSNRKLYFMTLYSQHIWLSEVLSRENEIGSCPAFHHEVVTHQNRLDTAKSFYEGAYLRVFKTENFTKRELPYFPEYALNVDTDREVHLVESSTEQTNLFVKRGLNNHFDKNIVELKTLCETGRSDNYYIFENLSNHFLKKPEFHYSQEALKALLKTPLFSNMLLFQSMLGDRLVLPSAISHFPFNSYNVFEEEVFSRVKVDWVKNYFYAVKSKRASQVARYQVK